MEVGPWYRVVADVASSNYSLNEDDAVFRAEWDDADDDDVTRESVDAEDDGACLDVGVGKHQMVAASFVLPWEEVAGQLALATVPKCED